MDNDPMWLGLKIGDWATWLAGTATFLAVCAAIGVPWIQACRDNNERKRHETRTAQILNSGMFDTGSMARIVRLLAERSSGQ